MNRIESCETSIQSYYYWTVYFRTDSTYESMADKDDIGLLQFQGFHIKLFKFGADGQQIGSFGQVSLVQGKNGGIVGTRQGQNAGWSRHNGSSSSLRSSICGIRQRRRLFTIPIIQGHGGKVQKAQSSEDVVGPFVATG
jgi:hypothetical protein